MKKVIITIRHGKSLKNIQEVNGGDGADILNEGVNQVLNTARTILKMLKSCGQKVKISIYKSCERKQVHQTAYILSKILGVKEIKTHKGYAPIRLGALDGLTDEEQRKYYPIQQKAIELWCKGKGDIRASEFGVPGLQTAKDYTEQLKWFLDDIENHDEAEIIILVGTRSDMSALQNVLTGNDPDMGEYKYYSHGYAQATMYYSGESFTITSENQPSLPENI